MSDMQFSGMNIRVNPETLARAEPILAAIGLSVNDVFNLMLDQICLKRELPFELPPIKLTENGYTPEFEAELIAESDALHAAIANGTVKGYRNTTEMFAEWDKEDEEGDD